ncbi:hypothetical protein SLEP1_g20464 [Rubroshorea leprosula]|uniref:Methyltransferase-related protein n=1 Tax=Rubroshorea leprosula TaxID=152421 RepID=A0AAV5J629_9ROSI|nr:hypothetical protein SLEP1_g20464 [Rubroshorea leprosula]
MCPLRFILVFFSAVLAGYLAWRTVRSSPDVEEIIADGSTAERTAVKDNEELNFKRMVQSGFWVFVDMASGKYLWRNLRDLKKKDEVKSC